MLSSTHRTVALGCALCLLIVVQQVAVVPWHGRLAAGINNAAHGLWFAAVTAVVFALVRTRWTGTRALTVSATAALVLALATEAAQIPTGRFAQWQDVVFDLFGAASVLLVVAAAMGRLSKRHAVPAAVVLLAITLFPAIIAAVVQMHRNTIFPALVDFPTYRFGGLLTSESDLRTVRSADGSTALEIVLNDDTWPGVYLPEPVPDWRAFELLAVDAFVPEASAPLELHVSIRLRGGATDHVYRTFVLPAGAAALRLRLRELFDPAANSVTAVVIYSRRPYAGRRVVLRRVALEGVAQGY